MDYDNKNALKWLGFFALGVLFGIGPFASIKSCTNSHSSYQTDNAIENSNIPNYYDAIGHIYGDNDGGSGGSEPSFTSDEENYQQCGVVDAYKEDDATKATVLYVYKKSDGDHVVKAQDNSSYSTVHINDGNQGDHQYDFWASVPGYGTLYFDGPL